MQPYERIGFIALMFFVVLLVVGGLWKDGSDDKTVLAAESAPIERVDEAAAAREAAAKAQEDRVRAARARLAEVEQGEAHRGAARSLRMGGQDELESRVNRVTTASAGSDHRSGPLSAAEDLIVPAKAQSADELAGIARPSSDRARRTESGETVSMNQRSSRRRAADEAHAGRSSRRAAQPEAAAGSDLEARGDVARLVARDSAAKPAAIEQSAPKPATYTVQPGDVLQRIASRELGDAGRSTEIASLNGLENPDMITVGMVLTLPARISGPESPLATSSTVAASDTAGLSSDSATGQRSYTVKSGESLSLALTRELGTYKRSIKLVQALNPGLNPDRVRAGQVILLPRLEDIPADASGAPARKSSPSSGAPALDTSPRSSAVAAAERPAPARTNSSRSDDEFVVR
jgi:LysM repeat protein